MKKIYAIGACIILFVPLLLISSEITTSTTPLFQNQEQNRSSIRPGEIVMLSSQGRDDIALDWAWLVTNESGEWNNFKGFLDWNYYKEIVIDHSKVEEDLIDFPLLISYTFQPITFKYLFCLIIITRNEAFKSFFLSSLSCVKTIHLCFLAYFNISSSTVFAFKSVSIIFNPFCTPKLMIDCQVLGFLFLNSLTHESRVIISAFGINPLIPE